MSEGKSEVIQFPKDQALTPEVKRIIKKVVVQTRTDKDARRKSGIVDIDEQRFNKNLDDAVYNSDPAAE